MTIKAIKMRLFHKKFTLSWWWWREGGWGGGGGRWWWWQSSHGWGVLRQQSEKPKKAARLTRSLLSSWKWPWCWWWYDAFQHVDDDDDYGICIQIPTQGGGGVAGECQHVRPDRVRGVYRNPRDGCPINAVNFTPFSLILVYNWRWTLNTEQESLWFYGFQFYTFFERLGHMIQT